MRRWNREWSACLLGSGWPARSHCQKASGRWYHGGTPRIEAKWSPEVEISDVVEEWRVEYAPGALPDLGPPGPNKNTSSPSNRKWEISRNPVNLPQKFEFSNRPANSQKPSLLEDPNFASTLIAQASRGKSHRSERDQRAAPVSQIGLG